MTAVLKIGIQSEAKKGWDALRAEIKTGKDVVKDYVDSSKAKLQELNAAAAQVKFSPPQLGTDEAKQLATRKETVEKLESTQQKLTDSTRKYTKVVQEQNESLIESGTSLTKFERGAHRLTEALGLEGESIISQLKFYGHFAVAIGAVATIAGSAYSVFKTLTVGFREAGLRAEDESQRLKEQENRLLGLKERYGEAAAAIGAYIDKQNQLRREGEFSPVGLAAAYHPAARLFAPELAAVQNDKRFAKVSTAAEDEERQRQRIRANLEAEQFRKRGEVVTEAKQTTVTGDIAREAEKQIRAEKELAEHAAENNDTLVRRAQILKEMEAIRDRENKGNLSQKEAMEALALQAKKLELTEARRTEEIQNSIRMEKDRVNWEQQLQTELELEEKEHGKILDDMEAEAEAAKKNKLTGEDAERFFERQAAMRAKYTELVKGLRDLDKQQVENAFALTQQEYARSLNAEQTNAALQENVKLSEELLKSGEVDQRRVVELNAVQNALLAQRAALREDENQRAAETYSRERELYDTLKAAGPEFALAASKAEAAWRKAFDERKDFLGKEKELRDREHQKQLEFIKQEADAYKKADDERIQRQEQRRKGLTDLLLQTGTQQQIPQAAFAGRAGGDAYAQYSQDLAARRARVGAGYGGIFGAFGRETPGTGGGYGAVFGPGAQDQEAELSLPDQIRAATRDPEAIKQRILQLREAARTKQMQAEIQAVRAAKAAGLPIDPTRGTEEDIRERYARRARGAHARDVRDVESGNVSPEEQAAATEQVGRRTVDSLVKQGELGTNAVASMKDAVSQLTKLDQEADQNARDIAQIKATLQKIIANGDNRRAQALIGRQP